MADEFDENDFEEDFQEADEPDEPEDLDAAEGDQEQIDILPAGKYLFYTVMSVRLWNFKDGGS